VNVNIPRNVVRPSAFNFTFKFDIIENNLRQTCNLCGHTRSWI